MSVLDKGKGFYEYYDITDPTPYETDTRILDGEECMICGREFHRGERIMEMKHRELSHDRFLLHEACLNRIKGWDMLDVLDDLGFEVDETEVSD